ncbi:MAG TPA: tripartite tricarboxylate transporter TctB family protein [Casimicrobiaceae bacterium]|nr:tripartite tricarboxylate transporter TctB family protein [Casimicrobiaceae bacterium]
MPNGRASGRDLAQIVIAGALVALAIFVFFQIRQIPADGGYSAVGPRFTPLIIAAGLAIVGGVLLVQALTRGWKSMEGSVPAAPLSAPAFAWISGGLVLHMIVIGFVGFTIASTMLFAMVARGFGSRRVVRDATIGLVLAVAIFLFFTRVLNVALPASPLRIV